MNQHIIFSSIKKIIDYITNIKISNNDKIKKINKQSLINNQIAYDYLKNKINKNLSNKIIKNIDIKIIKKIIFNNFDNHDTIYKLLQSSLNFKLKTNEEEKIRKKIIKKNKKILSKFIFNKQFNLDNNLILNLADLMINIFFISKKSDIYLFIINCNNIANKLNSLAINNKLYVLCPGDSPYKIIKYLEEINLCPNCIFISFPLSRGIVTLQTYQYISNYLPDDLCNFVVLDYIESGYTLSMIYNSFLYKIKKNKINYYVKCIQIFGLECAHIIYNIYPNLKKKLNDLLRLFYG